MKRYVIAALGGLLAAVLTAPATAAPQPLVVGPGKVGSLKMGTSTRVAQETGWIVVDAACQGWTAGPLAYKTNRHGEVYKAYPDQIKKARIASMWATGQVVTARGIRTQGLGARAERGSTVISLREAYPGLIRQGSWYNSQSGDYMRVFTIGDRKQGYLDFFVAGKRISFVVARTKAVAWNVGPTGGC
jgi:hypothetical protein